jgi:hypothetical protein
MRTVQTIRTEPRNAPKRTVRGTLPRPESLGAGAQTPNRGNIGADAAAHPALYRA